MKFVIVSFKRNYGPFRKFDIVTLPEEVAKKLKELDVVEIVKP